MSVSTECSFRTESDWQPPSESTSLNSLDMDLPHSPTSPRKLLKVGSVPSARCEMSHVSDVSVEWFRRLTFSGTDSAAPYIEPEPCHRCVWVSAPACVRMRVHLTFQKLSQSGQQSADVNCCTFWFDCVSSLSGFVFLVPSFSFFSSPVLLSQRQFSNLVDNKYIFYSIL